MRAESFQKTYLKKIFTEKKQVLDIGGGLRISHKKGNRYSPSSDWLLPLAEKIEYKIMDPVDTYHPDIVGDIHHMPFPDNALDAIICMSVLEHVENPIEAARELHRVLKPGGYCFVYVPFLYYYHAERGYYADFWRFSRDAVDLLFKEFSHKEVEPLTGATEMWLKISPFGDSTFLRALASFIDRATGKDTSFQTSGYNVFLVK
jgi:SAM-dependent methyltransferase